MTLLGLILLFLLHGETGDLSRPIEIIASGEIRDDSLRVGVVVLNRGDGTFNASGRLRYQIATDWVRADSGEEIGVAGMGLLSHGLDNAPLKPLGQAAPPSVGDTLIVNGNYSARAEPPAWRDLLIPPGGQWADSLQVPLEPTHPLVLRDRIRLDVWMEFIGPSDAARCAHWEQRAAPIVITP